MDFSDHVLLLTDGKQAWAIDKTSRRQVSLEAFKKNKTAMPSAGGFATTRWDGRNAVVVRLPTPEGAAKLRQETTGLTSPDVAAFDFEYGTHEQFHTYVQLGDQQWPSVAKLAQDDDGRDETYPLAVEPRLQRTLVYNSLLAAYQHPEKRREHLAAAAYWHRQWATKYPQEEKSQAQIDLLEGTTQYVETMAGAMAQVDDPQNNDQLRAFLLRTLRPLNVADKGEEPYAIGAAALLNADAMGRTRIKHNLTTDATTPAAQVLNGVTPAPQTAPDTLTKNIEKSVAEQNTQLATTIDPFVEAMRNKNSRILLLPGEAVQGSLQADSYTTKELPISIKTQTRAAFRLGSGEVTLDQATAGEVKKNGKTYYALPLSPDDRNVITTGGKITLKDKRLSGSVTVETRTEDGQRMLYAQ